jgi:hypothetical protein
LEQKDEKDKMWHIRRERNQENLLNLDIKMAGAVGFEPTNADSKDPCLAAWRRPSNKLINLLLVKNWGE